jgi:DNA end-binding protein Ku
MTIALADQPQRAGNSFTLSWGMVSIPVSLYTGTEETRVSRKEFIDCDGTLVAVGRSPIRKDNGEVVDSDLVGRYAEASTGELVPLTDDEIAACTAAKGFGTIEAFVPAINIGQYSAVDQGQLRPKATKGKMDPGAAKAFRLLINAMAERGVVALIKVALRGPARFALLDTEGTFTWIRTADAVRQARPLPQAVFSENELTMAALLIDAVGIDTPTLTDDTAPAVRDYVESKATGKAPVLPEAPDTSSQDLMQQLLASIEASKAKAVLSA